jgi:hypothetical protein
MSFKMDDFLRKTAAFRRLAEQTVQLLDFNKPPNDLILDAWCNAVILTELQGLRRQITEENYNQEDDELYIKLNKYKKKLKLQ